MDAVLLLANKKFAVLIQTLFMSCIVINMVYPVTVGQGRTK